MKGIQHGPDLNGPIKRLIVLTVLVGVFGSVSAARREIREARSTTSTVEVIPLPPDPVNAPTGVQDGPDIMGPHGKKGSVGAAPCSNAQQQACAVACFTSPVRAGNLIASFDCHLGMELTGEYMSGPMAMCTCTYVEPTGGTVEQAPKPPPVTVH